MEGAPSLEVGVGTVGVVAVLSPRALCAWEWYRVGEGRTWRPSRTVKFSVAAGWVMAWGAGLPDTRLPLFSSPAHPHGPPPAGCAPLCSAPSTLTAPAAPFQTLIHGKVPSGGRESGQGWRKPASQVPGQAALRWQGWEWTPSCTFGLCQRGSHGSPCSSAQESEAPPPPTLGHLPLSASHEQNPKGPRGWLAPHPPCPRLPLPEPVTDNDAVSGHRMGTTHCAIPAPLARGHPKLCVVSPMPWGCGEKQARAGWVPCALPSPFALMPSLQPGAGLPVNMCAFCLEADTTPSP